MYARSMQLLSRAILVAVIAMWGAASLLAGAQSPAATDEELIVGTWNLNVAQSKYSPGPAPRNQKRSYAIHPEGVKATITTTYADGHSETIQYVAKYDGIEYPVTGSAEADAIALKRINAYTAEATLTHAGKIIGTARRVISQDGKTMTITFKGSNINNVAVYEKEGK